MIVQILHDVVVSKNLNVGDATCTCAYPLSTVLQNGDIACFYHRGREKHSYDGVLWLQTSSDQGRSWSEPIVVFDGLNLNPPQSFIMGGACQGQASALLATFGLVDVTCPDAYLFSEKGREQKRHVCAVRSDDNGRTWSKPVEINTSPFPLAGVTTKPFTLHGGGICVPVEVKTSYGPEGTAATFTSDGSKTFEPLIMCAEDMTGNKNLCDARFTTLLDGRILMLLWTFLENDEQTICVHQSFSSDNGRTWSTPTPTSIIGQVTAPLGLPSGAVIAASNFRLSSEGIRLWFSPDGGATWESDTPLQMWDARKTKILGEPVHTAIETAKDGGVWEALAGFTFGTPDLVGLQDGTILLTYYATIDEITHIRACRFRLKGVSPSMR